jgi:hypothetical protein
VALTHNSVKNNECDVTGVKTNAKGGADAQLGEKQ